ncbi:MAG: PLD nuclease N-terminal domain-containing protein [Rhodothermales bacterium]
MPTQRYRFLPTALLGMMTLFLTGCGGPNLADYFRNSWGLGCCGTIILILNIIALVEVFGSNRDTGSKVLWCLLIFFFPILGLILYYLFGRED